MNTISLPQVPDGYTYMGVIRPCHNDMVLMDGEWTIIHNPIFDSISPCARKTMPPTLEIPDGYRYVGFKHHGDLMFIDGSWKSFDTPRMLRHPTCMKICLLKYAIGELNVGDRITLQDNVKAILCLNRDHLKVAMCIYDTGYWYCEDGSHRNLTGDEEVVND